MNRLAKDPRFELSIDYEGPIIANACHVTLKDPDVTLKEVADLIYEVAQHAVLYEGNYLAGSAEDRHRHQPKQR